MIDNIQRLNILLKALAKDRTIEILNNKIGMSENFNVGIYYNDGIDGCGKIMKKSLILM